MNGEPITVVMSARLDGIVKSSQYIKWNKKNMETFKLSTPAAIIIAALLLSFTLLVSFSQYRVEQQQLMETEKCKTLYQSLDGFYGATAAYVYSGYYLQGTLKFESKNLIKYMESMHGTTISKCLAGSDIEFKVP
jgi:hypothetical protein